MNAPSTLPFPALASARCRLRPLRRDDLEPFTAYRADPDIARYQSWSEYRIAEAEALLADLNSKPFGQPGQWYQIALAEAEHDRLLGDLAVHVLDDQQIEIGFTLAPSAQGRGLASEALRTLLDWYFIEQRRHRVVAITDARNHAAAMLLTRLGFRCEAQHRQNVFFKGAWGDEYVFACLGEEWRSGDARAGTEQR